ncbi:hypothetical protein ZIOFF_021946 [Zingiber officinale]|uniref:Uncharacterized protein n=1 Tax=Zingiber officinale TaxID=94328 RepID=A0A8J5H0V8_ZINOF|nr:hypothetical protein ZIOFF_021946 [Zingiber officinale]
MRASGFDTIQICPLERPKKWGVSPLIKSFTFNVKGGFAMELNVAQFWSSGIRSHEGLINGSVEMRENKMLWVGKEGNVCSQLVQSLILASQDDLSEVNLALVIASFFILAPAIAQSIKNGSGYVFRRALCFACFSVNKSFIRVVIYWIDLLSLDIIDMLYWNIIGLLCGVKSFDKAQFVLYNDSDPDVKDLKGLSIDLLVPGGIANATVAFAIRWNLS